MFLSPGQSPRHLSSPSTANSPSPAPPSIPGKQPLVLDEDTYVAEIEKIIERDFFPDIPKLRDRLDLFEACNTRDPVMIRELKIMERRGLKLSADSSARTRTPGSTHLRNCTPFDEFDGKSPQIIGFSNRVSLICGGGAEVEGGLIDPSLSLDQFFRRYTSEDNHSFSKVLEKVNRKRKERYEFLTEGEKEEACGVEDAKRDRITDGYGTSDQPPSTLDGWKYTAKNLLMYHPADCGEAPLTVEE